MSYTEKKCGADLAPHYIMFYLLFTYFTINLRVKPCKRQM